MKAERRKSDRKATDAIIVTELTSLSRYQLLAREGVIKDASTSGFLLCINRKQLVPIEYKQSLSLSSLVGEAVVMFLPQMNLDLDGKITRATHTGRGEFEIAIDFSPDTPNYWKECLVDLLPAEGELVE